MTSRRRLAAFNRRFANRVVGPVLTRLPGFGAVEHRGRRSGRVYRTPVKLFRRGETYLVSLPYGSDADWVRNVLAAGGCELRTLGRTIQLGDPHVFVDHDLAEIPRPIRAVLKRVHAVEFLSLEPRPMSGPDPTIHPTAKDRTP
jgi:deazaflavin-dependent oxidoreductase (nitroreductase family)